MPINRRNVHWTLALIDNEARKVYYLDPFWNRLGKKYTDDGADVLMALCKYMSDEHEDKLGKPLQGRLYTAGGQVKVPIQMNDTDCGAFLCAFCELLVRGVEISAAVVSQDHMPYWRKRILISCVGKDGAPCILDAE